MPLGDADVLPLIRRYYALYTHARMHGVCAMFVIGVLLRAERERRRGTWERWVATHCPFSVRTARNFVSAVERFPELAAVVWHYRAALESGSIEGDAAQIVERIERLPRTLFYYAADVDAETLSGDEPTAIATALIVNTLPETAIKPSDIADLRDVVATALRTGALDAGEGEAMPFSQALQAEVVETVYERLMRQREHIRAAREATARKTVRVPLDDVARAASVIAQAFDKDKLRALLQQLNAYL